MTSELPGFSPAQWDFLAVLEALETPVPIDIVGTLVPLPAVPLFDLIRRGTQLHILEQTDGSIFSLSPNLPSTVSAKLKAINTAGRVSEILDQLSNLSLLDQLDATIMVKLLLQAQRVEEAASIQLASAEKAILAQDVTSALNSLMPLVENRRHLSSRTKLDNQLITMVLDVSDLCLANGKSFQPILTLLQNASVITEKLGDKRSQALINMNIGRFLFLSGNPTDAFKALSAGKLAAEALGDDDILSQTGSFMGLYWFIQGEYKKALAYFETIVAQTRLAENDLVNPFAPAFFSLSALPFYQFDRAFTILDVFHQKAEGKKQPGAAVILRTVLGYILLRHQKEKEAIAHLSIAQNIAAEQGNMLALFWAKLFLSYHQFLIGNLPEARNLLLKALNEGTRAGLVPLHAHFPWIAEMLLEFEHHNIRPLPDCKLDIVVESIMAGPTLPAKGWVMRILARRVAIRKGPVDQIQRYLIDSIKYYKHSEFKAELSKTQIEMARLELSIGNRDKAQAYAREAWRNLPTYAEHIFPDDLQHLIENVSKAPFLKSFVSPEVILNRCSEIMERIFPATDLKVLLGRLVTATNWFFSAERSGFFLFEGNRKKDQLQLLGAVNLTEIETASENFKPRSKAIIETVRGNRPVVKMISAEIDSTNFSKKIRILCFPFHLEENRQGVLYLESSAVADCFDYLNDHTLHIIGAYLEGLCRRIWEYCLNTQRKATRIHDKTTDPGSAVTETVIGQSPVFIEVLKKAKRIANADYPILIQGETGVGKEVIARLVHKNSPRHDGPYIIIDSTTIAENLMESELFGHEKGAFTGADRQKPGRVELAGGGTLFLDEIGELPLSIQAKLLRVLEEKTFTRVGGSRVHQCDFRLIAATNRDLTQEVRAGRFREDLFYRLNVLPLQIPPLRERREDILPLARYFLEISCKRLKRSLPPITPVEASALLTYPWPGNIRELKNIIERGALLSGDDHLEFQLTVAPIGHQTTSFEDMPTMTELQQRYIAYVLETTGGRIGGPKGAAEILGLNRGTLYSRMKKLGMLDSEHGKDHLEAS